MSVEIGDYLVLKGRGGPSVLGRFRKRYTDRRYPNDRMVFCLSGHGNPSLEIVPWDTVDRYDNVPIVHFAENADGSDMFELQNYLRGSGWLFDRAGLRAYELLSAAIPIVEHMEFSTEEFMAQIEKLDGTGAAKRFVGTLFSALAAELEDSL